MKKPLGLYHTFTPAPAVPAIGKNEGCFRRQLSGAISIKATCGVGEKSAKQMSLGSFKLDHDEIMSRPVS
jgi:hypothetical protein